MYEQPQTEEIKLSMNTSLLAGSGGGNEGDLAPAMHELNDDFEN